MRKFEADDIVRKSKKMNIFCSIKNLNDDYEITFEFGVSFRNYTSAQLVFTAINLESKYKTDTFIQNSYGTTIKNA